MKKCFWFTSFVVLVLGLLTWLSTPRERIHTTFPVICGDESENDNLNVLTLSLPVSGWDTDNLKLNLAHRNDRPCRVMTNNETRDQHKFDYFWAEPYEWNSIIFVEASSATYLFEFQQKLDSVFFESLLPVLLILPSLPETCWFHEPSLFGAIIHDRQVLLYELRHLCPYSPFSYSQFQKRRSSYRLRLHFRDRFDRQERKNKIII